MSYNPNAGGGGAAIGAAVTGGVGGGNLYIDSGGLLAQDAAVAEFAYTDTYNPANFLSSGATKQFWLPCDDATKLLKTGGGNPANNETVETMLDADGVTSKFNQTTLASQPTFKTAQTPAGTAALHFTGTGVWMETVDLTYTQNKSRISLGVVFSAPDLVSAGPIFYRDRDGGNTRERLSLTYVGGNGYRGVFTRQDGGTTTTLNTVLTHQTVGAWSAMLLQWDVLHGLGSIWFNGRPTVIRNTAIPPSGLISNTASTFIRLGGQATPAVATDLYLADAFLFSGEVMTDWQVAQWFQAVKLKFGLTLY